MAHAYIKLFNISSEKDGQMALKFQKWWPSSKIAKTLLLLPNKNMAVADFSYRQRIKCLLLEDTLILEQATIQPQV